MPGAAAKANTVALSRVSGRERLDSAILWLELQAPRILAGAVVLWIAVIFIASIYKYETYGQGYDQVDFEQGIWNTTQGRPMADSRFNFTGSVFGMDWMPMLFFFVPFYAAIPSAHTLFFLQIVGAAVGAIPLYWLARDKLGSKLAGLGFGISYLLYPVLLHGVLNPFQVRLFAVSLLLFAFWAYEKSDWKVFWPCIAIALTARTDVAFVVLMFGVYGFLSRKRIWAILGPLIVGALYFAVATYVIVPAFAYPGTFSPPSGPITDPMLCWPCGISPQLAYYGHLGSSGPAIIWKVVSDPVNTFQLIFTPEKIWYMVALLLPLMFLSLVGWRPLVLGLPVLALNLLSTREAQYSIEHHYSLLLIPGIFASAVYGASNVLKFVENRRAREKPKDTPTSKSAIIRGTALLALLLVTWGLIMQVPFKNPAVRAFLYPESGARVAAAKEFEKMIPADAKVAVSSKLAPHLLPRQFIYNFPPAPYSPYNFGDKHSRADYVDLDFILVDVSASALSEEGNNIGDQSGLQVLDGLPNWKLVGQKEKILLYQRTPGQ